jgi:hypothetical protein
MKKLITGLAIVAAVVGVATMFPDIVRYVKISTM